MAVYTLSIEGGLEDIAPQKRRRVENAIHSAVAADRLWFQNNLGRQTYIRLAYRNEIAEAKPNEHWFVAIRQLRPGVRKRWGFRWTGEQPPLATFGSELVADCIFDFNDNNPGQLIAASALANIILSEMLKRTLTKGTA